MPTVAVNQPKSPVTKGSGGIAAATLPNICKMPGPPAPFVPVPLPNIGTSDNSPQGYSTSVTMDGDPVAIQGASFLSKGDVASQGTGGGIISSNVQGPTTFIGPGALNVQVEGKNVQLLGDPMLNNGGPSGSPANAATMAGIVQGPVVQQALDLGVEFEVQVLCQLKCECEAQGRGQECVQEILDASDAQMGGNSPVKAEVSYRMKPPDGPPPAPVTWAYPFRFPVKGCPRPDAIIVDSSVAGTPAAWRGDNLKAVVEMKLGKDPSGGPHFDSQMKNYTEIAGGDVGKVVVIDDDSCKCVDDKPEPVPVPAPAPDTEKAPSDEDSKPLLSPGQATALEAAGVVAAIGIAAVLTAPVWVPAVSAGAAAAAAGVAALAAGATLMGLFSPSKSSDPGGA